VTLRIIAAAMMEDSLLSPSALTTRDRCSLKHKDPVSYSHLYHRNNQESNVWSRLTKDAARRKDFRPKNGTYQRTPMSSPCNDSGFATNNNTTSGPLPPKGATPPPEADVRSLHFKTLRSFKKVRLQSAWRVVWDVHSWLSGEGKEDKPNEIVLPMCPFICYPLAEISYRVHVSRSAERADTQQHACNVGQPAERP